MAQHVLETSDRFVVFNVVEHSYISHHRGLTRVADKARLYSTKGRAINVAKWASRRFNWPMNEITIIPARTTLRMEDREWVDGFVD